MADNQVKIRVGADLSEADAATDAFAGRAQKSFSQVGPAVEDVSRKTKDLDNGILSARESARLATEELGIHMPRAVTGALAEMLPAIGGVGVALLGAFAVAEIPKFIGEVKDATATLAGYTDEVREAEQADVDASLAALTHFTTIARGTILIAETNRELANLASKQGNWQEEAKAADTKQ